MEREFLSCTWTSLSDSRFFFQLVFSFLTCIVLYVNVCSFCDTISFFLTQSIISPPSQIMVNGHPSFFPFVSLNSWFDLSTRVIFTPNYFSSLSSWLTDWLGTRLSIFTRDQGWVRDFRHHEMDRYLLHLTREKVCAWNTRWAIWTMIYREMIILICILPSRSASLSFWQIFYFV